MAETYLHCEYQANGFSYRGEILRRVSGLSSLEQAGGAAYTLWQIADTTIRSTTNPDCVDWHAVDKAVVIESIGEHQQTSESVAEVLCKYSPGTVSLAGKAAALDAIDRFILEQSARPSAGHAGEGCEP